MPANEQSSITRRDIRVPESAGRVLDAAESDGQRVVTFTNWLLITLRMAHTALGVVVDQSERVVPDPTEAILGGHVRVPEL